MKQFEQILVTLDGSALAERALLPAAEFAIAAEARLILLRVVTPVYLWAPFVEIEPAFEIAWERAEEDTAAYLNHVKERVVSEHPSLAVESVVLSGQVAETIIDFARERRVDLIVISSHGRSGVSRWVYGSVAEKVLRGASCCSILVVRGERSTSHSDEAGLETVAA